MRHAERAGGAGALLGEALCAGPAGRNAARRVRGRADRSDAREVGRHCLKLASDCLELEGGFGMSALPLVLAEDRC